MINKLIHFDCSLVTSDGHVLIILRYFKGLWHKLGGVGDRVEFLGCEPIIEMYAILSLSDDEEILMIAGVAHVVGGALGKGEFSIVLELATG